MSWLIGFVVLAALAGVALAGVSSYGRLARRASGPSAHALPISDDETAIDHVVAPLLRERPGRTGVVLLADNLQAFAVRAASARQAGRSLDLQYYYWLDDLTGGLLLREVIAAADRGVRVRLLIDDISMRGRNRLYRAVETHPAIEVRLFNPSRNRGGGFRRGLELLARFVTATRRMHNKAWIADGRIAIIGGRNIGDAYFDAAADSNFHDMDLALAGEALEPTQRIFDEFWNSAVAIPIGALFRRRLRLTLDEVRERHEKLAVSAKAGPYVARLKEVGGEAELLPRESMRWIEDVEVLSDKARKALGGNNGNLLAKRVGELVDSARADLAIISPYFIPGDDGMAALGRLSARGVRISVLTNSLAATDVVAVHGAYAGYRRRLLEQGVALFELRPELTRERGSLFGSKGASLHTKAFTVDCETAFVGSFNFDPRSRSLNTEMGVIVHDRELACEIDRHFREQTGPDFAYAVTLREGRLCWGGAGGAEPAASFYRRCAALAIGFLPVESQL
jgi:putative cardiolipin synthase